MPGGTDFGLSRGESCVDEGAGWGYGIVVADVVWSRWCWARWVWRWRCGRILQQRLDSIAIMKSLGAGSRQIMKIYLLQTLLLGLGGGPAGCVAGDWGAAFVSVLPGEAVAPYSYAEAGAARDSGWGWVRGLLTTLLFTLPPLLDIRNVRPILILRRNVEASDDPFAERLDAEGCGDRWRRLARAF